MGEKGGNIMNLKEINTMDLINMRQEIDEELKTRKNQSKMAIYKHDCFDRTKNHLRKYKHWAKWVKSVDISKSTGYAFSGEFLPVDKESKIPEGAIIVEVCDSDLKCYEIKEYEKRLLCEGEYKKMVSFIEQVAKFVV